MSLSTKRDELRRACLAGNQEACVYIRDLTGFAEGGLMEDSSRLWRMESQYPEFQKGISSRVTKEQVPTTPVEEQFMYSPTQQGYNKGGVVPPGVLKRSPGSVAYLNEKTGEWIPGEKWMVNPRIPPGILKRSKDTWIFENERTGEKMSRFILKPDDSEKGYAEGGPVRSTEALLEAMDESPVRSTEDLLEVMDESPIRNSEEIFNYYDETGSMLAPEVPLDFQDGMPGDMPMNEGTGEVLTPEETEVFSQALSDYPELQPILTKLGSALVEESMEAPMEGAVEGPGTGTSDSIDAKLSDGEFVFTAKAVKQLGVDKLRKMMSKAEIDFDESSDKQTFAQMSDEGFAAGGLINRPVYS
ncbi:MAG: hypothetical protein ABGY11_05015 [Candidatus Thioglobus sp.]|jgi:hypothetical protein